MKMQLASTTAVAALLALSPGAQAKSVVADIYGSYDAACGSNIDCTFGTGYPVTIWDTSNGASSQPYDTPNLFIVNTGANALTGLTITATGYQGLNNGISQSLTIPNVAAHSVLDVVWTSSTSAGSMFGYDYDDEYGFKTYNSACNAVGSGLCAQVGNFDVSLTGTLSSNPVSSSFSPDNHQDGGNQQAAFVGWEGIDPNGWSESIYDIHSGSQPGVLAYIYTGTHGGQTTPESSTWAMMAVGFAGVGSLALARRRKKAAAAAV